MIENSALRVSSEGYGALQFMESSSDITQTTVLHLATMINFSPSMPNGLPHNTLGAEERLSRASVFQWVRHKLCPSVVIRWRWGHLKEQSNFAAFKSHRERTNLSGTDWETDSPTPCRLGFPTSSRTSLFVPGEN